MKSIVLIQARLSSSRLPAKVLLPINSIPLVVLAAKRASSTGREVLVVTSTESSDDVLCHELNKYNIKFYRGSLNNTLSRFVSALKEFDDQTIVFRLTADNVFPDGSLLDELEAYFELNKLSYLVCNGEQSGLPYGLSVEVMRLCLLRDASLSTKNSCDLEHVTPYLRRKFGEIYYQKYQDLKMGAYRCTIDSFDDYLTVAKIFSFVEDPVKVSWKELLDIVKKTDEMIIVDDPVKKLVLGGAQLGLSYGINNSHGKPNYLIAERIVKKAVANGVDYIDTARVYGDSEEVLGRILQKGWKSRVNVITKLSPLNECSKNSDSGFVLNSVRASVFESCQKLRIHCLDCLMLHRVEHLLDWKGLVWKQLLNLKKDGAIKSLGASVQSPEELDLVLEFEDIEFIQMPFNILDSRWDSQIEKIKRIKSKRNLIIHSRSALLQGLLASSEKSLWDKANISDFTEVMRWLNKMANEYGNNSVVALALNYVKSQSWIDGVVVGMETEEFLNENLELFSRKPLSDDEIKNIECNRPILSEATLNPANWTV